jgi:adenylate cyclase, class 2
VHPSIETEIKLKVRALGPIRQQLQNLGFVVAKRRRFERNVLFDTSDDRLRRAGCLLRLRSEAGRSWLTLKGPPRSSKRYKTRPEWEARISSAAALKSLLESLGLREVFRYEKFRTTFAARAATSLRTAGLVELDETPIGNFLELEGPGPWIDRTASRLGYEVGDYITASYGRLYELFRKARGRRPENMIFSRGKT